jgi:hypothetical protein
MMQKHKRLLTNSTKLTLRAKQSLLMLLVPRQKEATEVDLIVAAVVDLIAAVAVTTVAAVMADTTEDAINFSMNEQRTAF